MPKFLLQGTYTLDGAKGLAKDGGSGRKTAIEALAKSAGGKLEHLYFPLGTDDFLIVMDLPDSVAATSVSMAVAMSGAAKLHSTPLLTVEEMDTATKKSVSYRAPGK